MPEGPIYTLALTATIGFVLTVLTWYVARRSGLAPLQMTLVDTLQDTVQALEKQMDLTEDELKKALGAAEECHAHAEVLRLAIVDLAAENAQLRHNAGLPPRHRTAVEREAAEG